MGLIKTQAEWLVRAVSEHDSDECLLWPGSLHWKGYGQVRYQGKTRRAHRVACELAHGPAPSRRHVAAHSCHVRCCVNGRHLRWALPADNSSDMVRAERSARGEVCASSKLREKDVRAIRESNLSGRVLAREYGIAQSNVVSIRQRRTWRHV